MAFKKTFLDYINEINLVEFLGTYGFIKKDNSWKDCTVMQNEHGEILLVRQNNLNNQYYFTNPNDYLDKGNVISFICKRHVLNPKYDFVQINQILEGYRGSVIAPVFAPKKKQDPEFVFNESDLLPYTDKGYLLHRGISLETLESDFFKGTIFNYVSPDPDKKKYVNTAFPLYDEHAKIVGCELKNYGFGGNVEGSKKSEGIWTSNAFMGANAYISESAIDLLSYQQLNNQVSEKRFFMSGGGSISHKQVERLDQELHRLDINELHLLNDNDFQGLFFDLMLSGYLLEGGTNIRVFVRENKTMGKVYLDFVNKNLEGLDNWSLDRIYEFFGQPLEESTQYKKVYVFDRVMENYLFLAKKVLKVRYLEHKVFFDKPDLVYKDFNDQLRGIVWVKKI